MASGSIGVDLGGTKIEVAWVSDQGVIGERLRFPTHAEEGAECVVATIVAGVRQLVHKVGERPKGVGIGVAGQIDWQTGSVVFAPNLKWHNVDLGRALGAALALPVRVINDVRAAAWAEWLFGAGQGAKDLLCLFIGTGVGGGVVSQGCMIEGDAGSAGEIGHLVVAKDGPLCACGRRGCIEAFIGGASLARRAQESPGISESQISRIASGHAITTEHIIQAYRQGDPLASQLLSEAKEALVSGTASLINILNPEKLVLGGGIVDGLPEILDWLKEGVSLQALKVATRNLKILLAHYGNEAGVVGAAAVSTHSTAGLAALPQA